jgi:hypothetical protein
MSTGGDRLPEPEQQLAKEDATLLQDLASSSVSEHRRLYRGAVMDFDTFAETHQPGQTLELDSLTAATPDEGIAEIYTDLQFVGAEDNERGWAKIVYQIDGETAGIDRPNQPETILPRGSTFEVVDAEPRGGDGSIWDVKLRPLGLSASGWDESQHPRDPGGDQGGQFVEKGTTAVAERPMMGLGTPEQEANLRSKNAVPPLVEEQMEADLKAFLDESDLQMRMPESALLEVLSDGEFYNQHQAQAARGMGRSPMSEALMFGLDEATDPSQLPKYGYLGPDTEGVIGYGGVKVFFKDEVKDRSTFVVGDSLMHGPAVVMPSPVRDPSYLSAGVFQIDEAMTAWADSMGMIGEYDPENPESGMNLRYGSETDFIPSGEGWHYSLAEGNTSVPYFEAQIYGKLTPDDIERVEILPEEDWDLEDPLTGLPQVEDHAKLRELIAQLEKRKIPVGTYDAPGDYSGEWA